MTGKDVLPEKDLLQKVTIMKRIDYSNLDKELKAQTDTAKKQYQKLNDTYEFNKIIKKEKPTLKNYRKSNLTYNANHTFDKYHCDSKKFNNLSSKSKYSLLVKFFKYLNKFNKLKTKKERTKKEKLNVYDAASELYNELIEIYFDEYNE